MINFAETIDLDRDIIIIPDNFFKEVARIMGRSHETVSRYVHEQEAVANAVRVVVEAQNT